MKSIDTWTAIIDAETVADGKTKDTPAIQKAIDACAASGGGTVRLPAGTYLAGTVWLKSHVNLHLEAGAVLKGSPDRADYNADDAFPQNEPFIREEVTGAHLILAVEVNDVSLTGQGTIDGNNKAFYGPPAEGSALFTVPTWRPGQMVYFCECTDVKVEGVRLLNAPYWDLFVHGCERVRIDGLFISNDRRCRNGDGIDIDCSRDVTVSNCIIRTSDDCITLRAHNRRLRNPDRPCENVTVTNCILSTRCCAIRVGVGDGVVRNAVFSNLVMDDTRTGVDVICRWSPRQEGVEVENLRFSNFIMDTVVPFCLASGYAGKGTLRNLAFSNIQVRAVNTGYIGGTPERPACDIRFHNVDIEMWGGRENSPDAKPPYERWEGRRVFAGGASGMPHAFYMAYAHDVVFRNCRLRWGKTDGMWTNVFRLDDCSDVQFRDCVVDPPPGEDAHDLVLPRRVEGLTCPPAWLLQGEAVQGGQKP